MSERRRMLGSKRQPGDVHRLPEKIPNDTGYCIRCGCGSLTLISGLITFCIIIIELSRNYGGFSAPFGSKTIHDSNKFFNFHPLAMSLGILLLNIPAILSYEVCCCTIKINKLIHGFCNTLALILMWYGFGVIYYLHNQPGKKHFNTIHSNIGFIILILFTFIWIVGIVFYGCNLCSLTLKKRIMPIHKRMGISITIMGLSNILLGLTELGFTYLTRIISVFVLIMVVGIITIIAKFIDKKKGYSGIDGHDDELFELSDAIDDDPIEL